MSAPTCRATNIFPSFPLLIILTQQLPEHGFGKHSLSQQV